MLPVDGTSNAASLGHFSQTALESTDSADVYNFLRQTIVHMHKSEQGPGVETGSMHASLQVRLKLLIVPWRGGGSKRQKSVNCDMACSQYAFVEEAKHADISSQLGRSKIVFNESNFLTDMKFLHISLL